MEIDGGKIGLKFEIQTDELNRSIDDTLRELDQFGNSVLQKARTLEAFEAKVQELYGSFDGLNEELSDIQKAFARGAFADGIRDLDTLDALIEEMTGNLEEMRRAAEEAQLGTSAEVEAANAQLARDIEVTEAALRGLEARRQALNFDEQSASVQNLFTQIFNLNGVQETLNLLETIGIEKGHLITIATNGWAMAVKALGVTSKAAQVAVAGLTGLVSVGVLAAVQKGIQWFRDWRQSIADAKQAFEDYTTAIGKASSENVNAFMRMSQEWQNLGDNLDAKKKYLIEHKDALEKLGGALNSVEDAENALVANTSKYIDAQIKRAEADYLIAQNKEKIEEYVKNKIAMEGMSDTEVVIGPGSVTTGGTSTYQVTNSKKEELKKRNAELLAEIRRGNDDIAKAQQEGQDLLSEVFVVPDGPEKPSDSAIKKAADERRKVAEESRKAAEEQERNADKARAKAEQARLKAAKEEAALADALRKEADRAYKAVKDAQESIDRAFQEDADSVASQESLYNSLLEKYGTYEEKKTAIHLKYLGLINAADGEMAELLKKAMKAELDAVKETEEQTGIAWTDIAQAMGSVSDAFAKLADGSRDAAAIVLSSVGQIATGLASVKKTADDMTKDGVTDAEKLAGGVSIAGQFVNTAALITDAIEKIGNRTGEITRETRAYQEALRDLNDEAQLKKLTNAFGTDALAQFRYNTEKAKENLNSFQADLDKIVSRDAKKVLDDQVNRYGMGLGTAIGIHDLVADNRSRLQKLLGVGKKGFNTADMAEFYDQDGAFNGAALDEWYKRYGQGLQAKDKAIVESLIDDWKDYQDALQQTDEYMKALFGDAASSVADKMIDKFMATGDAIADMTDLMGEFDRSMAKSVVTSMLLENVFTDEAKRGIQDALAAGNVAQAVQQYQSLLEAANEYAPNITAFLQSMDLDAMSSQRTNGSTGFAQASQDSINELNGRATAIQGHTFSISENMNEMKDRMADVLLQLSGIHTDTTSMARNMESMRADMGVVRGNMDVIMTKGVDISR